MQVNSIRLRSNIPARKQVDDLENEGGGTSPEGVFFGAEAGESFESQPVRRYSSDRVSIGVNASTRRYSASITEFNMHVGVLNIADVALGDMADLVSELKENNSPGSSGVPDTERSPDYEELKERYIKRRDIFIETTRELPPAMEIGVGDAFAIVPERPGEGVGPVLDAVAREIETAQQRFAEIQTGLGNKVDALAGQFEPHPEDMEVFDDDMTPEERMEFEIFDMIESAGYRAIHVQANLDPLKVFELIS